MKYLSKIFMLIFLSACFFGMSNAQDGKNRKLENAKTTPVKITNYPQPTYTPEAKRNDIEGIVKLRVTFLASGKIGEVTEIVEQNKRELRETGLVNQAIKAAKNIKFKPAIRGGNPITITKTVVYTFTLY